MRGRSENVGTMTEDIANINVAASTSTPKLSAKIIWTTKSVTAKAALTGTLRCVSSGSKTKEDVKEILLATFSMLL